MRILKLQAASGQVKRISQRKFIIKIVEIIHYLNKSGIITIQRMCSICQFYKAAKKRTSVFLHIFYILNLLIQNYTSAAQNTNKKSAMTNTAAGTMFIGKDCQNIIDIFLIFLQISILKPYL